MGVTYAICCRNNIPYVVHAGKRGKTTETEAVHHQPTQNQTIKYLMNTLGPLTLKLYSISRLETQYRIASSRDSATEPLDLQLSALGVVSWLAFVLRLSLSLLLVLKYSCEYLTP